MKKFILALTLTLVSSICALAQSDDDQKKTEFFAGYSYGQAPDAHFSNNPNIYTQPGGKGSGFNGSVVFYLSRYVGIKGDVSGIYNKKTVTFPLIVVSGPPSTITFSSKNSLYNFLGGVQVKDSASKTRVKPFAHAMVGAALRRNSAPGIGCVTTVICPGSTSETSLAMAFGGGLDIRVNRNVDVRAFQFDYNPIRSGGGFDNSFRVGIGVVFR